jgi:transcriptional regulator with XRE-family HTH domain|tara:strand:- start:234 stop:458 length:225 start_codon:yes stop_codon:yes gene_type:complete
MKRRDTWISITVRELRERNRLSRRELARRSGISASALQCLEEGRNHPNLTTLEAVLEELGHELTTVRVGDVREI